MINVTIYIPHTIYITIILKTQEESKCVGGGPRAIHGVYELVHSNSGMLVLFMFILELINLVQLPREPAPFI